MLPLMLDAAGILRSFDVAVLDGLNVTTPDREGLGNTLRLLAENHLFKGVFVMMLFWAAWFAAAGHETRRSGLIALVVLGCVAIAVGRVLAVILPFRTRPIFDPDLTLYADPPDGLAALETWSALPSDHAVLYFALATGLAMINRPLGIIALLHAALIVCLPRMALGLHFPTDILSGALIGTMLALLLLRPFGWLVQRIGVTAWEQTRPALFYAMMFAFTFQMASMFDTLRAVLKAVKIATV